ncbi:hypothetical protein CONPUDRAFT_161695 [Coniophora puteana RWD-64-598 SS2]|uniref:Uncharacterized protein n=1 Tax=Coniophora puteana (strain RWD-64-598) TaxID=741705 RepID=A0A5M3N8B6_CONPW|nr:uncharacterized protein CONPUDRAFT_161695 [Coniophora puteana RWD-64-598 SS2]EIW87085.1 hypothetical protein CONPUDRAFT_161695 [Coniophora puteana RWD-64-598 SS2]
MPSIPDLCPCPSCSRSAARSQPASRNQQPFKQTSYTRAITRICIASAVFGALSPVLLPLGRFALRTTWQQSALTLKALPGTVSQVLSLASHALYAAFGVGVGFASLVGFEASVTVVTLGIDQMKALLSAPPDPLQKPSTGTIRRDAASHAAPRYVPPPPPAATYRASDIDYDDDLFSQPDYIADSASLPRSSDIDYDDIPPLPSLPYQPNRGSVYDNSLSYSTRNSMSDLPLTDAYQDALAETMAHELLSSTAYSAPRFRMCSHGFADPNNPSAEGTSTSDPHGAQGSGRPANTTRNKNAPRKKSRRSARPTERE